MPLSFPVSVEDVNIVSVAFLVSEEYSITHYCLDLWQNEEATSDCHQMAINTTTTLDFFELLEPPFQLYCKLKISLAEKYPDWREMRSHGKTFLYQSYHFRFRIQNLRRHDQTGKFSFRIRPLRCKRQNESGTISSIVNLVQKTNIKISEPLFSIRTWRLKVWNIVASGQNLAW